MINNKLEDIISRLKELSGKNNDRSLSLWLGKREHFINNWKLRGKISIKSLMEICDQKCIDFKYIYEGIHSEKLVYLKDDEMVVKIKEYDKLVIENNLFREINAANRNNCSEELNSATQTSLEDSNREHEKSGKFKRRTAADNHAPS